MKFDIRKHAERDKNGFSFLFFLFSKNRFIFYPILNGLSKLSNVIITHSVDSFGDSAHINMFCKVIVRIHERAGSLM